MSKFLITAACIVASALAQTPEENAARLDNLDTILTVDALNTLISSSVDDAMNANSDLLWISDAIAGVKTLAQTNYITKMDAYAGQDLIWKANDALKADTKTTRSNIATAVASVGGVVSTTEDALEAKLADTVTAVTKIVDDKAAALSDSTITLLNALQTTYFSSNAIPVFRWNQWHTHQHRFSWIDDNRNTGFGGVHPSQWTDGNYRADQMANDFKYLSRLFIRHATASSYGATVCTKVFGQFSSTDGGVCGAVFRIRNTGTSTVSWKPDMTMTSYKGWSETASISLNGANNYNSDCVRECRFTQTLNIPASSSKDRISTVVFISTSSLPYAYSSTQERSVVLMFRDNALKLPSGLEFVDDLDTITGPWKK